MTAAIAEREAAPKAAHSWFGGLDGLRALAVIAVVVFHFQPTALPGGFLGVDLFFVISGYLITRLLLGEIDRKGCIGIKAFYLRRARRLLPAVVALLVVVSIAGTLVWRDQLATLRGGVLAGLFYVSNWWLIGDNQSYFVHTGRPSMLQHMWSLAIEEQYYLVWPLLLTIVTGAYLWRRHHRAQLRTSRLAALAVVACLLAFASTAAMTVIAIDTDVPYRTDSSRVYFGTGTHAMGLLLGAAAGALATRAALRSSRRVAGTWLRRLRGPFLSDIAAVLALVALVRIVLTVNEFNQDLYRGGFLVVSALCAVLVLSVARRGSAVGWLLDREPLRWIGKRSYGIYLWHWPVTVVTRPNLDIHAPGAVVFLIRVAITLVLTEASYRFVEQPIRRYGLRGLAEKYHWRGLSTGMRLKVVPVAAVVALAMVGSLAYVLSYSPRTAHATSPIGLARQPSVSVTVTPTAPPPSRPAPSTPPATSASTRAGHPVVPNTPATTHRATPTRPPVTGVSAFGDSVMLGAAPALSALFPNTHVDAVEGIQAYVVFDNIAAQLAAGTLQPVVVIHTGNNGIISPDQLADTLRSLASRQRVVVLTDRVPRDWEAPNNATLQKVVPQFHNAVLVDWYHNSAGHGDWFYGDGLHLRPDGAAAYAQMIAKAIRS